MTHHGSDEDVEAKWWEEEEGAEDAECWMLDVGPLVGPDELELAASYICVYICMYEKNRIRNSGLHYLVYYVMLYYITV